MFIVWVKWLFWLRRWKEVLHVYIHNLELDVIPNQIVLYNSLSIIMGIILHDVLQKTIKIFYFSRFKPSSLQFTPTQLLRRGFQSIRIFACNLSRINPLWNGQIRGDHVLNSFIDPERSNSRRSKGILTR